MRAGGCRVMSVAGVSLPRLMGEVCRTRRRGGRHTARAGFVWFVVALLVLNFGSVLLARPAGQPRVNVPFSPYFVSAVRAGRVASIASKGDTIQGTLKVAVRYPAQNRQAPPTTLFSTEVPTFWNDNQLTGLLQAHGVQINASSPNAGGSLLGSLLLGFGPTLLIVGLFVLLRARGRPGGRGGCFG